MPQDHDSDDAALVRSARQGDRQAAAVLIERHLAGVFRVVARLVGPGADAEDLAQDTFVRAFERLEQYQMVYSFRNWLLKIASNLAINHLRARQRERQRYPRIAQARAAAADRGAPEAPSRAEWDVCLARLNESERAAIVLFHFEGLSYAEVAALLEVPLNTVRTWLHRGRRRLRDILTAHVPESGSWTVAM